VYKERSKKDRAAYQILKADYQKKLSIFQQQTKRYLEHQRNERAQQHRIEQSSAKATGKQKAATQTITNWLVATKRAKFSEIEKQYGVLPEMEDDLDGWILELKHRWKLRRTAKKLAVTEGLFLFVFFDFQTNCAVMNFPL
jgi:hypothetical protein